MQIIHHLNKYLFLRSVARAPFDTLHRDAEIDGGLLPFALFPLN